MSSTLEKPLDLSRLTENYDILGEFSGSNHTRNYAARRLADGREVLITVLEASPEVAQGKAIAQFAADANLLTKLSHPNVPRVLEARWIGDDAFALITERVQGTTLAEQLKGERLTKPRIAAILGEVDGVLNWARGERLSHRNVTPESLWIERGTGKVFVLLSPTEAPKTNRPDPRDDARTIGQLAVAMLAAKPMSDDHDGSLFSMRPDLPERVAKATEKVAACTINDEVPDIPAFLASMAMADAIKEGELEVARIDAEFRAQLKAEREKWEAEQEACRLSNENQAKKFAEERAEYERRSAKEREQLAEARAEIDKRRAELQAARAELDQARAAYKQKKSELEARAKQVDRHMSDLEKQKRALEKRALELTRHAEELEARNRELTALAALASAGGAEVETPVVEGEEPAGPTLEERIEHVGEITRPTQQVPVVDDQELDEPADDDVEVMQDVVESDEPERDEPVQPWMPIESEQPWAVPLETDEPVHAIQYEAAAVPVKEKKSRPAWAIPAGIGGAVLLLVGSAFAIGRQKHEVTTPTSVVSVQRTPAPAAPGVIAPTAVMVDSAAGSVVPTAGDSAFAAIRDSIAAADEARRIRREQAAADQAQAERRAASQPRTYTDSTGKVWYYDRPPAGEQTQAAPPQQQSVVAPPPATMVGTTLTPPAMSKPDSALKAVIPRLDSTTRPKPDTGVKVRPDTGITVRPDTGRVERKS
jgi:hypothetical protein